MSHKTVVCINRWVEIKRNNKTKKKTKWLSKVSGHRVLPEQFQISGAQLEGWVIVLPNTLIQRPQLMIHAILILMNMGIVIQ